MRDVSAAADTSRPQTNPLIVYYGLQSSSWKFRIHVSEIKLRVIHDSRVRYTSTTATRVTCDVLHHTRAIS